METDPPLDEKLKRTYFYTQPKYQMAKSTDDKRHCTDLIPSNCQCRLQSCWWRNY